MLASCQCCMLSGRSLCVGLVTRPEVSYRVCLSECDREALTMEPWPTKGCCDMGRRDITPNNQANLST